MMEISNKVKAIDFLGKELNIGDKVVFVQLGYRNLLRGEITKITEKTVTIKHNKTNTLSTQTKQFHNQVVKYKSGFTPGLKDNPEFQLLNLER